MKKFTVFFSFLLIFTFFFVGSSLAAETEFPELPTIEEGDNYTYVINRLEANKVTFLRMYVPVTESTTTNNYHFRIHLDTENQYKFTIVKNVDFDVDYILYRYVLSNDGQSWILQAREEETNTNQVISFSEIYYSNVDIYTSADSDEVFFQQTPLVPIPTVAEMVATEVPVMAEKVKQAMTTILLCGVGCLALVISLPLFGKVFRIFQVK